MPLPPDGLASASQARVALRLPWWTLQTGFEMAKSMAEMSGSAAEVRDRLDDSSQTRGPLPPGIGVGTKTDSQARRAVRRP